MDDKIKSIEEQIKQLTEKKTKLIKEKKEKEEKQKRERAIKVYEVLSSMGIDTFEKATELKKYLENDPNFKNFILKLNVETVGGTHEKKEQEYTS